MCPRAAPALCERVQRQLYYLALPDAAPKTSDFLAAQVRSDRRTCYCDRRHAPRASTASDAGPSLLQGCQSRGRSVFDNPQALAFIFAHMGGDVQSLLKLCGVSSASRGWALSMLCRPVFLQGLRAAVLEAISAYRLECLRMLLAFLASACVDSSALSRDSEDGSLSTSLLEKALPRLPCADMVIAVLQDEEDIARLALTLAQDIPRLYPTESNVDKDVLYGLACRQRDASDLAKLLLIRDRASPEAAAIKTGRSPLADLLQACKDTSPEWKSGGQHFLPLDITWMYTRGFKLRYEDVDAMRRTGRTEIWEGALRLAFACDRYHDLQVLLEGASRVEHERAVQIELEERKACEQFRGRDTIFGIPTTWTSHRRARSKSDFAGVSEEFLEAQQPSERRTSLTEMTEEMLTKAAAKSRKWAHALHR